ncbi:MAG: class I SAM-dependent methyltransferase [Pseudomonadota bacterium]
MSHSDREKWDRRYAAGEYESRPYPSALLTEWCPPPTPGATALDIACGLGRNARYLKTQGYRVDGVDVSQVAIDKARTLARAQSLEIDWHVLDLDQDPLPVGLYSVIVVSRFLDRRLVPAIQSRLAPGGRLIYEQHVVTTQRVGGPRSAQFRLQPNELLRLFATLHIAFYREGVIDDPDGAPMAVAQLVGEHHLPRLHHATIF